MPARMTGGERRSYRSAMATKKKTGRRGRAAPGRLGASTVEVKVEVKVDRALQRAWKTQLAELEECNRSGTLSWDRKYEAVGAILQHNPPLYLAGGVSTVADFVRKYLPGEDVRSVQRNVRVAQYASPDEEIRHGTSNIDLAIKYLEAKHGAPAKGRIPVDFAKLRVPTDDGSIAFVDASTEQLRDAARLAERSGHRTRGKPSPVVAALIKRLPAGAKGVTVHYADGHVSLGKIPLALFVKVVRALAAARLPDE